MTKHWRDRIVLAGVALAVGSYYLWQARAANGRFDWKHDSNGFYNLLARGFLAGHLYTPVQPSPKLLAMPDPWDPAIEDSLRWQDMALYNGHYYLYFGAAPVVALFAPYRAVTGHDLPENFAICVLCFAGFLFSCGALLRVLDLAGHTPGTAMLAALFVALGVCQSAPFLLNRTAVYELAIASGYCCVAGAIFFLEHGRWAASGLMFGMAAASRPHLALAGLVALAVLLLRVERRRGAVRFATALAAVGLAIGVYNYERFGSPLEFGFRYQLAGPGQNRVEVAARNILPGSYYMLLSRPELSGVFPWMRMVFRFPFDSAERYPLPPQYFVEPTVGALWLAPFLPFAFWIRGRYLKRPDDVRLILGVAAAGGAVALLFLISTHLATHRYEVDFVPLLVFTAVANFALVRHRAARVAVCIAIAYSAAANLALAVQGPYDDFLRVNPRGYVRVARRLSLAPEYRPALDPAVAIAFDARFIPEPAGLREPLVTLGHSHHAYFLYAVRGRPGATGPMRLISKGEDGEVAYELPEPGSTAVAFDLQYAPPTGEMTVRVNGTDVLRQHVGPLVTAPAEIALGENYADLGLTTRRFGGALHVTRRSVSGGRP